MKKICSYNSIIRSSGIYDIIVMLPFAIPGVVEWTMSQITNLHNYLSLAGSIPELSPFHFLFLNIMAIVTIVWSVLRIRNPSPLYATYDTVARILIAITMLIYLLKYNVTELIWLFFMMEVIWTILQINGHYFKNKQ